MDQHLFDPYIWLSIGALLCVMEFMILPGIGFLLMGIAAFVMFALLLVTPLMTTLPIIVYTYMGVSFVLFFFFLKKLRRRYGRGPKSSLSFVGCEAEVIRGPVGKDALGRIRMEACGTEFSALLARSSSLEEVEEGAMVYVISMRGQLAVVKAV